MPSGDLLVLSLEEKQAKNGKPFLSLRVRLPNGHPLKEGNETIPVKIWENVLRKDCIPPVGRIISADYKEDEWNGQIQLVLNAYTLRPPDFPRDLFILPSAIDQDVVYKKLFHHVWKTTEMNTFFTNLRALLERNNGNLKKRLYEIPAGSRNHHARRAGLLQHVEEIWDLAELVMRSSLPGTPFETHGIPHFEGLVDREIVLAGIVMHDLGKIHDYSPETLQYEEDREGALFGHSNWGALTVFQCWPQDGNPERCAKLMHVVYAHHGSMSTGASINAKIPEASLVHLLDAMSARLDVHRTASAKSKNGGRPEYSKMLGDTPVTPTWPPVAWGGS